MNDHQPLSQSAAGMRLIAQTTLYNAGNPARLETFIASSYHPDLLAAQDVAARLAAFAAHYDALGRWKVQQTLAANKHHVIVVFATERDPEAFYYCELQVEDDYPHRIIAYRFDKLQEVTEGS